MATHAEAIVEDVAQELESRYRDGTVEESTSWRDLQRLDHLEYRRDQLEALLARVE